MGLQLDLVYNAIINHVAFVLGAAPEGPKFVRETLAFQPQDLFSK